MHDEKIYVSVGGLSFADVIYSGDFYSKGKDEYQVEFYDSYIEPLVMAEKYKVEILTDTIPSALHEQLEVVKDS